MSIIERKLQFGDSLTIRCYRREGTIVIVPQRLIINDSDVVSVAVATLGANVDYFSTGMPCKYGSAIQCRVQRGEGKGYDDWEQVGSARQGDHLRIRKIIKELALDHLSWFDEPEGSGDLEIPIPEYAIGPCMIIVKRGRKPTFSENTVGIWYKTP